MWLCILTLDITVKIRNRLVSTDATALATQLSDNGDIGALLHTNIVDFDWLVINIGRQINDLDLLDAN